MTSTALVRAAIASALLVSASGSARAADCKPVHGFYTSAPVPPPPAGDCASPVGFCTAGELIGGIQGTYAFTMSEALPQDFVDPRSAITFYKGASVVSPKAGGTVTARDYGTIDLRAGGTGRQSALLIIDGGTDRWAGATGFLQLLGLLDLAAGGVAGEYWGQLCTP